jgi:hypothetical protein
MYDALNDSRVRPAHLAMDGTIRERLKQCSMQFDAGHGFARKRRGPPLWCGGIGKQLIDQAIV